MASKMEKFGALLKETRTNAGLSQEKLAGMVEGLSASDISKAERGEKELTKEQVKGIAKAAGVTQKSLLDAMPQTPAKTGSTAGTSAAKTGEMKLTSTEKTLVSLYRKAESNTKKQVMALLKGEPLDGGALIGTLIGGALEQFVKSDKTKKETKAE